MIPTLAPCSRSQPPKVTISNNAALTRSTKAITAFIVFDWALTRFGRQSSYPGRAIALSIAASINAAAATRDDRHAVVCHRVHATRTWRNWHTRQA